MLLHNVLLYILIFLLLSYSQILSFVSPKYH
nr:MAG TPA: hypothetical protein [Bacteriophage sp.]